MVHIVDVLCEDRVSVAEFIDPRITDLHVESVHLVGKCNLEFKEFVKSLFFSKCCDRGGVKILGLLQERF